MACKFCKERGKTWHGSPPQCAFNNGMFSSVNWNCATMNILREIAEPDCYVKDQRYAIIPADNGVVFLSWYKNRGCTDSAYFVDLDGKISPLLIETAERIAQDALKLKLGSTGWLE